jgi:hypothetical protein
MTDESAASNTTPRKAKKPPSDRELLMACVRMLRELSGGGLDHDHVERVLREIRSDVENISERLDDLTRWVGRIERTVGELRKQTALARVKLDQVTQACGRAMSLAN